MRLIDADELKKAIIHQLCIRSEENLLESERSIYNLIDKQPTIELLKEQEAMNVDSFVQWCIDSHIMGDATVRGIKYWVGRFKEGR